MSNKQIKEKFNHHAEFYDQQRRYLIPRFNDLYCIAVEISSNKTNNPRILDLGAGTGLLTQYFLNRYSEAEFTLIDISDKMLDIAKERFKSYHNFKYLIGDYVNTILRIIST